ncbi:MAG: DUF177 domain-containing protein [Alphaproteobacteria bacterium]|nr:DUF177 domain-containing protein [Alphaproteobacteria bacterium]
MKLVPPEFSRLLPVDRVPPGGCHEKIAAEPAECDALARRFGVPAVHALSARLHATPWRGGGLMLDGNLEADLDRVSVVSLEVFRETVTYPVLRYFLPPGMEGVDEEDDADPIVAGHVDMGETVAETLALELDPYPKKPGETFHGHDETEDGPGGGTSPFEALSKLRRK